MMMKNWQKWINGFLIFLLLIIGISGYIFIKAQSPLKSGKEEAFAIAKKEAGIISPEKFYLYHGTETYYVVVGQAKNKKKKIVWIPENKKRGISVKALNSGISESEAIQKVLNEKNIQQILAARLGMEKDIPIWEVSNLDQDDHLNYYYIHFETGEWWRKIKNL